MNIKTEIEKSKNEGLPRVSMSLSAHYVTQTSIYECPKLGPLTNHAINKYEKERRQREGLPTSESVKKKLEQRRKKLGILPRVKGEKVKKEKVSREQRRKNTLAEMLEMYT